MRSVCCENDRSAESPDSTEAGDRWLPLLWGGVLALVFSGLLMITLLLGRLLASRESAPAFEPVSLPVLPLLTAYVLGGVDMAALMFGVAWARMIRSDLPRGKR
jgi:hypothetical protein